jgi:hypothetical protein
MLGGVGFQAGLDEARRKQMNAEREKALKPDVVAQLKELKGLHDAGFLTPEELQLAKRRVLAG